MYSATNKTCFNTFDNPDFKATSVKGADGSTDYTGFTLTYSSHEKTCLVAGNDTKVSYTNIITATCDSTVSGDLKFVSMADDCTANYAFSGKEACAVDFKDVVNDQVKELSNAASKMIQGLADFYGAFMIGFGLILCLYGYKMIQITIGIFVFGSIAMSVFMFSVVVIFGSSLTGAKVLVAALLGAVAGGFGAKYLTKYTTKYGIGLLAAWGLLSVGFLVIPLLGLNDKKYNMLKVVLYIILGVAGFLSAAYFSSFIEVQVTAFIGAYSFVRGISIYAGGFINELEVDEDALKEVGPEFYGYLVGIVAMWVIGSVVQTKLIKREKDRDNFEKDFIKIRRGSDSN